MANKTHKPGIHENYLMRRHLKIEGLDNALIEPLVAQLTAQAEVDDASISKGRRSTLLCIGYDASLRAQPLDGIEQALALMGARFAADWWSRFKRRFYAVTDQNIYDNARHQPSCCSKPPPGK